MLAKGGRRHRVWIMDRIAVPSVADYMTTGPHMVGPYESLPKAHEIMREHGIRHLPVVAEGTLVGILSDRYLNRHEKACLDAGLYAAARFREAPSLGPSLWA